MRPVSPWAYSTPFAIGLQQSIAIHAPELADELAALGGTGEDDSLLLAGERAQLLAAGKSDALLNYSQEARALLAELRPGSTQRAKQAEVEAVIGDLEQRATATEASRPEREQARREAELAGRQASQKQAEAMLQQAHRLGGG